MDRIARELLVLARQLTADDDLSSLDETLYDLDILSSNLDRAFEDFGKHFRMAALDTEVVSQFELLDKAYDGLENAEKVKIAVKKILESNPEDKTAIRVSRDAEVMIGRFQKHVADARKVVMTISKKNMPESLKKYASDFARIMRSKLEDPNTLTVIPWQRKFYNRSTKMEGVLYQAVFRINTGRVNVDESEVSASEFSTGNSGITFSFRQGGDGDAISPREAVERFVAALKGWAGLKGESAAISQRAEVAQKIVGAVNRLLHQFDTWRSPRLCEVLNGNTRIDGGYRSNLPKEGERQVGESKYEEMVREEMARWKKALDTALSPFMSSIKDVQLSDGEKSWIYTHIELK